MAAKTTKAQLAAAAKAAVAAPGQSLEEGATASASEGAGAPGGESGVGAVPGGVGEDDSGAGGDESADAAGQGSGQSLEEGATGGEDLSGGAGAGDQGDQLNTDSNPSAGPTGETDADALATASAESTFAAFEGGAKDLGGLEPEAAAAATVGALLAEESTQTPDELTSVEPVLLNVWAMPDIWDFPALLTLSNNTASRFSVKPVNRSIPAHESITVEFDRLQYRNLKRSLAGPARLDKWDSLYGVQVTHEPDRSESND